MAISISATSTVFDRELAVAGAVQLAVLGVVSAAVGWCVPTQGTTVLPSVEASYFVTSAAGGIAWRGELDTASVSPAGNELPSK